MTEGNEHGHGTTMSPVQYLHVCVVVNIYQRMRYGSTVLQMHSEYNLCTQ